VHLPDNLILYSYENACPAPLNEIAALPILAPYELHYLGEWPPLLVSPGFLGRRFFASSAQFGFKGSPLIISELYAGIAEHLISQHVEGLETLADPKRVAGLFVAENSRSRAEISVAFRLVEWLNANYGPAVAYDYEYDAASRPGGDDNPLRWREDGWSMTSPDARHIHSLHYDVFWVVQDKYWATSDAKDVSPNTDSADTSGLLGRQTPRRKCSRARQLAHHLYRRLRKI